MHNRKIVVAVCLVALALSAVAAASASGATGAWMVNGSNLTGSAAFASSASVESHLALAVKNAFTITCQGSTFKAGGAEMIAPNKIKATLLEFTGCNGGEGEACKLNDETISTVPVVAESGLEGTLAAVATLKPQTKTVIATVDFVGATCVLNGVIPITGSALVLSPTARNERITQQSVVAVTEASGELKVGSSAASANTTATTRLVSGLPWSFL